MDDAFNDDWLPLQILLLISILLIYLVWWTAARLVRSALIVVAGVTEWFRTLGD